MTPEKSTRSRRSAKRGFSGIPFLGWVAIYHGATFFLFASVLHPLIDGLIGNQLPGPVRIIVATALLLAHLVLISLPAMEWSRRGISASFLARGLEVYVVFLLVYSVGWAVSGFLGLKLSLRSALGLLNESPWFYFGALTVLASFISFSYFGSKVSPSARSKGKALRYGGLDK